MAKRPATIPARILNAAMKLAGERRWGGVTLGEIAVQAKVTLAQLHKAYPSKTAIVLALMEKVDEEVLGGVDPSAFSEPPRDRLLDAVMRRLDALAPDKPAIGSILRAVACDPVAGLCAAPGLLHSMAWTLEAAGIGSAGVGGRLRVKGLAMIYLSTLRVWLRDDSRDQAKTMAHLDQRLRQAERLLAYLPDGRRNPQDTAA